MIPFGPNGLMSGLDFLWGPSPFTGSANFTAASNVVSQIAAARQKGHHLLLAMAGGKAGTYLTGGKFDILKWKREMDGFKSTSIKNAIAAGVADGTVIGNRIMDEPETPKWGAGFMTKALLDTMADYCHAMFPTLPCGPGYGPPAYKNFDTAHTYKQVDFCIFAYRYAVSKGDVVAWREACLLQAQKDGVQAGFGLNLLDGGIQDKLGGWDCGGESNKGTYAPNCHMTAAQVKTFGTALAEKTKGLLWAWRYDQTYFRQSDKVDAFRAVASICTGQPDRPFRRRV